MNEQQVGPETNKSCILIIFVKWFRIYEALSHSLSRLFSDSSTHCKMTSAPTISFRLISQMLLVTYTLSETTDLLLSVYSICVLIFFNIVNYSLLKFSSPMLSVTISLPWFFFYFSDLSFSSLFTDNFPLSL